MSVALTTPSAKTPAGAFRTLVITEFRLFLREKPAVFWSVAFPMVLLVVFGSIPGFGKPAKALHGLTYFQAYVPILIAMVMMLLAGTALPSFLATYRERGVLRRLAVTPVGPARLLGAQLTVHCCVAIATFTLILAVARVGYGVALPAQPAGFAVALMLAGAALFALGLLVAALAATGRAANLVSTLLFFPMMFFAGLWVPIAAMPEVLRHISHLTPLGAAVQALQDASLGHWPSWGSLATLAGYGIAFGAAAVTFFRWE